MLPFGPPTLLALTTAFIADAASAGLVGSLGDLPSELIPPLVARVSDAAALATIADATGSVGRSLVAELDPAWERLYKSEFGAVESPAPGRWRRRYEAEAARRAARTADAGARVRSRFEAAAADARSRGVVLLDTPPPGRRGRGRGGRGGRARLDPHIPAPARILAKLGRVPEARAVVARASAVPTKKPVVFMRHRTAPKPQPPPRKSLPAPTPTEHAFG